MEGELPAELLAPPALFVNMPNTEPNCTFKSLIKTVHSGHRESNRRPQRLRVFEVTS